jgi:hypothetical protein
LTEPERASFQLERFELAGDKCLEVRGRWFGVRGRRFMRPALTAVADGRERRLLAVLDHKPWTAEDGEAWLAAFPWSPDADELGETELTVAPDLTVALPPPSSPTRGSRPRRSSSPRPKQRARAKPQPTTPEPKPTRTQAEAQTTELPPARTQAEAQTTELPPARPEPEPEPTEIQPPHADAIARLELLERDRDRLRGELRAALAARDEALAERHDVIEAEVGLRIAELRAEAERERAAAELAAQTARERDAAREARDESSRERDSAREERDAALRDRNRMLAERDTAQTRVEEVTRQWEVAVARGTRRTQERDALAGERDSLSLERDALVGERDALAGECDRLREFANMPRTPTRVSAAPSLGSADAPVARGTAEDPAVWRARLLAATGLVVAAIVLLILLLAG